ncbi:hypothetical protein BIFGAL_03195 [Bifidobacterium gallicum DSM 20093 = LMG 11596]|uniref:Uncharacterized protein n=1 Tax=Bifidobacterium gallicum DSM 20093 = LMG 11596 TaxID=561180 RepID=D1NTM8_9BIFI|nr:hypothetical protein BIFGAL_03195 [Bifidobacterium gallicum DSM 20093 = LMG 11596]
MAFLLCGGHSWFMNRLLNDIVGSPADIELGGRDVADDWTVMRSGVAVMRSALRLCLTLLTFSGAAVTYWL